MPLLLLCLGTILASSFLASRQPSSSLPPSSGSIVVAWYHLSSHSTTAPTPFCAVAPAPSPSESGHGTRSSSSAASRPAQQQTPSLEASVAAADCRVRAQADLPQPSGSRSQTRWFPPSSPAPPQDGPGTIFLPGEAVFAARDQRPFTASTDKVPIPSVSTATKVRPLTSSPSSRGRSLGGALWRAAYDPGHSQTSRVYPVNPVQYLYISCYVTANKLVLSYLSLRLLLHTYVYDIQAKFSSYYVCSPCSCSYSCSFFLHVHVQILVHAHLLLFMFTF
jgi:hypothetical protein